MPSDKRGLSGAARQNSHDAGFQDPGRFSFPGKMLLGHGSVAGMDRGKDCHLCAHRLWL